MNVFPKTYLQKRPDCKFSLSRETDNYQHQSNLNWQWPFQKSYGNKPTDNPEDGGRIRQLSYWESPITFLPLHWPVAKPRGFCGCLQRSFFFNLLFKPSYKTESFCPLLCWFSKGKKNKERDGKQKSFQTNWELTLFDVPLQGWFLCNNKDSRWFLSCSPTCRAWWAWITVLSCLLAPWPCRFVAMGRGVPWGTRVSVRGGSWCHSPPSAAVGRAGGTWLQTEAWVSVRSGTSYFIVVSWEIFLTISTILQVLLGSGWRGWGSLTHVTHCCRENWGCSARTAARIFKVTWTL